jgi:hypothetical protein
MPLRRVAVVALLAALAGGAITQSRDVSSRALFQDDFESGLSKWVVEGRDAVSIHQTATGSLSAFPARQPGVTR